MKDTLKKIGILVCVLSLVVFIFAFIPDMTSASYNFSSGAQQLNTNFTLVAGLNRIIVVSLAWESNTAGTDTVSSITYGGNAPSGSTAIAYNADGQPAAQYVVNYFWLEADLPADGSQTAIATISSTGNVQGAYIRVTQLDDMEQVVPSGSATASEADESVDVTVSVANSVVLMAFINNNAGSSSTFTGSFSSPAVTWDIDGSGGDDHAGGAVQDDASVGTFTASWTGGAGRPATTAAVMAPFGAGLPAVSDSGISAQTGNTTQDYSVTIGANTNFVIARVWFDGTPVGLAVTFDPAGVNVAMTEASGSGNISITSGGTGADYIVRTSGRGLSPGSYTIRITSSTGPASTLGYMVIDNADTSGAGPAGSIDYDREGVAGNGTPSGLTLTAGTDTLLAAYLTSRENRVETLGGDLTDTEYRDSSSLGSLGVTLQAAYSGTSDSSTVSSTYTFTDGSTGFASGAFTFAPAGSGGAAVIFVDQPAIITQDE